MQGERGKVCTAPATITVTRELLGLAERDSAQETRIPTDKFRRVV
jgi:hypothetical protein